MTVLKQPPALAPLFVRSFVRAAVPRIGTRPDSLPDTVLDLVDQTVDRARLADYQRVCGYRVADALPPLFLHLLAFPLSVQIMAASAFPFPLPGLVHVGNAVTQHRPIDADEPVSLRVHAADLREHPAGRQVDLVATARVGDEAVWDSRSTYLKREGGSGPRERTELPGQDGPVSTIRVPGDIGRRYAAVSGDSNPIHLHPLAARAFGFPRAIAHGMWMKARVLATLEGRLPSAFTVDVAFKTPVLLPASVSVATPATGQGWTLDVRDARSGKPHLTGTITPS